MRSRALLSVLLVFEGVASRLFVSPDRDIIPIVKTDFSLSTIPVEIGPSRKPLQLQLSFDRSSSFIYINEYCPPFIECVDVFMLPIIGVPLDLHLGRFVIEDHPFETEMYVDDMRDTAGDLGFGPGSVLAKTCAVRIAEQTFAYVEGGGSYAVEGLSFNISPSRTTSLPGNVSVPLLPSVADKYWMFEGSSIRLNGESIGSRASKILIDPSIAPIVIPYEHKAAVREILELQVPEIYEDPPTGDVYVACPRDSSDYRVKIELEIITSNGTFKINPTYSQYSPPPRRLIHGDTHFCQTHYRFGSRLPSGPFDRHTWIIGKPLFHNRPSGIIFDSVNSRLVVSAPRVTSQTSIIRYPVFPVKLWMPRYDPTVYIEQPNDSLTVLKLNRVDRSDGGGYVLRSMRLVGGRGAGMLDLTLRNIDQLRSRRVSSHAHPLNASRELPGVYHLLDNNERLRLNESDGSVSLYLTKAVSLDIPIYAVTILTTSSVSLINLRRVTDAVIDSNDLLLPPPVTVNETSSLNSSCCICLCDFATGDTVQSLPEPCTHRFHEACIKRWFRTGKQTCPLCISRVPYSSNPTVRRGVRTSPPPGGVNVYDVFANLLAAVDNAAMIARAADVS
jgi:hypothetical protein